MPLAVWIRRLALTALMLCLLVVVLGAYVRLSAAGLGCPDWPGCYGAPTPLGIAPDAAAREDFAGTPLDVGKAWREMLHRYAAGTLALIIVIIAALAMMSRGGILGVRFACALLVVVLLQASLGMLTVTLRLSPLIVTLHLVFGMTTLALLAWLYLGMRSAPRPGPAAAGRTPRRLCRAALVLLALQITLGGWTSSNYAATACPDFPTCQGLWWPPADFAQAFLPRSEFGVNYEGGVLSAPARTAIQLAHRLGAVATALLLVLAACAVLREVPGRAARGRAQAVLALVALQLLIAVSMVKGGFPLWLATAHSAAAALLLLAALALNDAVRARPASAAFPG